MGAGTILNTRNTCSVTNGLVGGGESANEARSDITAGAIQLAFHDAGALSPRANGALILTFSGTWDPNNKTHPAGADGCACDKFGPNAGLSYIKVCSFCLATIRLVREWMLTGIWAGCFGSSVPAVVQSIPLTSRLLGKSQTHAHI